LCFFFLPMILPFLLLPHWLWLSWSKWNEKFWVFICVWNGCSCLQKIWFWCICSLCRMKLAVMSHCVSHPFYNPFFVIFYSLKTLPLFSVSFVCLLMLWRMTVCVHTVAFIIAIDFFFLTIWFIFSYQIYVFVGI
jgi:hypothetical protein